MLFRLMLLVGCAGLDGVGTQMSRVLEFDCEERKLKSPWLYDKDGRRAYLYLGSGLPG
jgi:hypothetical protein